MNIQELEIKKEQLKKDNPIQKVAGDLGFVFQERNSTVAIHCFNTAAHPNGDKNPSLVLQPDTNTFECKSCGKKGDTFTLIQEVKGVEFKDAVLSLDPNFYPQKTENVFQPTDYLEYWKSRGITDETKEKFGLVLTEQYLKIPLGDDKYKLRNFLTQPKYKNPTGTAILFKTSEAKNGSVYLVESELDAIKLHQELGEAVWSSTTGANGFNKEWVKDFGGITKIYICYDNDPAGHKGAQQVASILGTERCYKISLPKGKDITEYFVKYNHTAKHFLVIAGGATQMKELSTLPSNDVEEDYYDFSNMTDAEIKQVPKRLEHLSFGIPKMDTGVGKIELPPGTIAILASQGVGKSWMMLHLARVFYFYHGKKTVIFTLEMSREQIKIRALQAWSHLTQEQFNAGADTSEGSQLLRESGLVVQEFGLKDSNSVNVEELERLVDKYYEKGHRVFQFDHLHEIPGMSAGKTAEEVSQAWSEALKRIKKKYPDIWFICYAQVNKSENKTVLKKEAMRYGARFIDTFEMFFSLNNPAHFLAPKNLAKMTMEKLEEVYNPVSSRAIFICLSKNRLGNLSSGGWGVYLSRTGNFTEIEDEDVQPDSTLRFTNEKPREFAPLPTFPEPKQLEVLSPEPAQFSSKAEMMEFWKAQPLPELWKHLKSLAVKPGCLSNPEFTELSIHFNQQYRQTTGKELVD